MKKSGDDMEAWEKRRGIGRRIQDLEVREKLRTQEKLFRIGQTITSEMNLSELFRLIMEQTNAVMDTERSSVFLYDRATEELWSLVATGMGNDEIRISSSYGVAGWVFQQKQSQIINDAYSDSRFYSEVDRQSGFRTRNILCIPLINREGECIGALQTLNKKKGIFNDDDREILTAISHYIAIALENSKLYKEVKDYSEELKAALIRLETLEKIKGQLTKFVPTSVVRLAEQDPDQLHNEKTPMDVSVLFIDIQGYSRITGAYDQKLVNEMVESHFSRYLECINRHGGEINETSGDGLMVIFREDTTGSHARDAVAAGLEIVSANRLLNKDLVYPWGRVDLHLGINSGEAWVGATRMKSLTGDRWTYTASGLVTVLAARIGAVSNDSRLLVGPDTFKYIEDSCNYESLGYRELKNVKEPIPIYWIKDLDPFPDRIRTPAGSVSCGRNQ